jgi:alkylation response protein AidB-like acyl-CoA dehydrogenase
LHTKPRVVAIDTRQFDPNVYKMAVSLEAISAASEQDDLRDLRDLVRKVVAKHLPLQEARHADAAAARRAGWAALAELGLLGIAIPERYGGSAAGLAEQAIVCEELAEPGCMTRPHARLIQ